MENNDLKYLKKYFGEKFAHNCRTLFPTILGKEGLLSKIISENFEPSHLLGEDIEQNSEMRNLFYLFVVAKAKNEIKYPMKETTESPEELLDIAGYTLYPECKTYDDILQFKKYYREDEELCTFREKRLETHRVFFAVKKNVDQIRREDFQYPAREDEYSTSVISIQFRKPEPNYVSIKSRYNHSVYEPDNVFSNNLDAIIPGLSSAFRNKYDLNIEIDEKVNDLPNCVMAKDGKYYRYHTNIREEDYFCENGIVISHGEIQKFSKDRYIMMENYIIDKSAKTIFTLKNGFVARDEFVNGIGELAEVKEMVDHEKNRIVTIKPLEQGQDIKIVLNKHGNIIEFDNPNITKIKDGFLMYNEKLQKLNVPNVTQVGNDFLLNNTDLKEINMSKITSVGEKFLYSNKEMKEISFKYLEEVGTDFLRENNGIYKVDLPNIKYIGNGFLMYNSEITEISFPKCKEIGTSFLRTNEKIVKIDLPNVEIIDDSFLRDASQITDICFPQLNKVGSHFMSNGMSVKSVILPEVKEVGSSFLYHNEICENVSMDKVKYIGNYFLYNNMSLTSISLPSLETIADNFLARGESIKSVELPKLQTIGDCFLECNKKLDSIKLNSVEQIGDRFMYLNEGLSNIEMNNVKDIGYGFLSHNQGVEKFRADNLYTVSDAFFDGSLVMKRVYLPKLRAAGEYFLSSTGVLEEIVAPNLEEIGADFLTYGVLYADKISLPNAREIGPGFMCLSSPFRLLVTSDCQIKYLSSNIRRINLKKSEIEMGIDIDYL